MSRALGNGDAGVVYPAFFSETVLGKGCINGIIVLKKGGRHDVRNRTGKLAGDCGELRG